VTGWARAKTSFFATVFLGSGFLLLAMLFSAAAVVGAIVMAFHAAPGTLMHSATFYFGRSLAYGMVNIYLVKTASVFMITTSTIALHNSFDAHLACGRRLRDSARAADWKLLFRWSLMVFPLWVLLVSLIILTEKQTERPT